ncbi:Ubiquitin carboxyl-terminal hydrolase [Plasmodium coatneyi]|uniref:Ubiquitin carboxyl-terminal hydrolase n=1 Tax=Plasmodium coatneyi TaxID=208452 RepID=A0A1B1DXY3_9APIC|nr:Ubiquitin carboxyl-terminal hydrolase [Plasmodium coatneyi]ANQ07614.1 Ubiquitin carboxyl-terminal hydrolase [Plasmodium coatneyi]
MSDEETCLKRQSSQKLYYGDFNKEVGGATCDDMCIQKREELKGILNGDENAETIAQTIAEGWCVVNSKCGKQKPLLFDGVTFYYWLGNEISNVVGDEEGNFRNTIGTICDKVKSTVGGKEYPYMCPKVTKKQFQWLKVIYDYTLNYKNGKDTMVRRDNACTDQCRSYVRNIKDKYGNEREICKGSGVTDCYKEIRGMFSSRAGRTIKEPSKLTCQPPIAVKPATAAKPVAAVRPPAPRAAAEHLGQPRGEESSRDGVTSQSVHSRPEARPAPPEPPGEPTRQAGKYVIE